MSSMRSCLGASKSKDMFSSLLWCWRGILNVKAGGCWQWIWVLLVMGTQALGRSSWCPLPWCCPSLRQPAAVPSPDSSRSCLAPLQSLLFAVCLECSSGLPGECSKYYKCGRKEGARIKPLIKGCLVWVRQWLKHSCHGISAPGCCSLNHAPHAPLCCAGVPGCPCAERVTLLPSGFGDSQIRGQEEFLQPQWAPLENKCMASR